MRGMPIPLTSRSTLTRGTRSCCLKNCMQLELDLVAWCEVCMATFTAPHIVLGAVPCEERLTEAGAGADAGLGRFGCDGNVVDGDDVGTLEGEKAVPDTDKLMGTCGGWDKARGRTSQCQRHCG